MVNRTLSVPAHLIIYDVLVSTFALIVEPRILPAMKIMAANPYNYPEPVKE